MVPVVLCDFRWLWIGEFLNESGADARRLVKRFTTFWSTVTAELDFSIWVRSIAPFWIVSRLSARRAAVSTWLFVVLVPPDEDDSSCFDWFLLGGVCGPSYHRTLALSRLFSLLIYFIEIESEINLSARNNWSYSIGTPSSYRGRYSRSPFSTWSLPFSTTTSPPTMVCVGSPVSFFP